MRFCLLAQSIVSINSAVQLVIIILRRTSLDLSEEVASQIKVVHLLLLIDPVNNIRSCDLHLFGLIDYSF
ncbi:hypothetical protein D3C80_2224010 [compost metagenome]